MGGKTNTVEGQFKEAANRRLDECLRVKPKNIRNLVANVIVHMALLPVIIATGAQAAPRGKKAMNASSLGLLLTTGHDRLMVVGVAAPTGPLGLLAGDQIVAVNGRRVSTEAAFMNRLTGTRNGTQATSITVARNGRLQVMNAPPPPAGGRMSPSLAGSPSSGGFLNPNQMVRTSQGVMHRDAAARLGLPSTPFP
jgi:predicted metalloprotease with PDZ domain